MDFTERKTGGRTIYDGKILKLCVDDVVLPDGKRSVREIVRHHGGAAVLYVEDGRVLLVRQFRYAYGRQTYEIPAGKLEEGENARPAAARELEEETGYRAAELVRALTLYPSPGYTDEVICIYFAKKCSFVGSRPDEGEFVSRVFMPLGEAVNKIESGEICDAKTVAAIYWYLAARQ